MVEYFFVIVPALMSLLIWHLALSKVSPLNRAEKIILCATASLITMLALIWYVVLIITWLEVLH